MTAARAVSEQWLDPQSLNINTVSGVNHPDVDLMTQTSPPWRRGFDRAGTLRVPSAASRHRAPAAGRLARTHGAPAALPSGPLGGRRPRP